MPSIGATMAAIRRQDAGGVDITNKGGTKMTPQARKQVQVSLPKTQAEELEDRATMGSPVSNQIERAAELLSQHFEEGPSVFAAWDRLPSLAKYCKESKRALRVYLTTELVDNLDRIADELALGRKGYLWPHAVELLLKSEEDQK